MRMMQYEPHMVAFMRDASENSGYYKELAAQISRHLPENAAVCDAGCGLGYLSLELSRYCGHVNAVDIAPRALDVLKKNMTRFKCGNISVIEGDINKYPPQKQYDAMVFCFFGSTQEVLQTAKAQCSGKVIMIKRDWSAHRFSLGHKPIEHHTLAQTCAELDERGICFTSKTLTLEMGQPFHTLDDATLFFRTYSHDDAPLNISEKDIMGRLIRQPSEEFPYYLPSKKQIGMIVVDTRDIPEDQ